MTGRGMRQGNGRTPGPWLILLSLFLLAACGEAGGPVSLEEPEPLRPCTFPDQSCVEKVALGGGFFLPVYRSLPITEGDTLVERAVIVVHGANRNPWDYFETMILATQQAQVLDRTLVVAPHFQTLADGPEGDEPRWTSGGWKRGDQSNTLPTDADGISSYGAVDRILALLGNSSLYPRLQEVVVTGHSAGGQYAHRFAAGSRVEESFPGLRFRYIVANPSTYLYLGPERAGVGEAAGWGIPDGNACPDYNHWHYGLERVNPYMADQEPEDVRAQLTRRDVIYLVGTEDRGSSMLDMSCGAMLQGPNRYVRGLILFAYLEAFHPTHAHQLFEVPGVGHSSRGIYTSPAGQKALFGG